MTRTFFVGLHKIGYVDNVNFVHQEPVCIQNPTVVVEKLPASVVNGKKRKLSGSSDGSSDGISTPATAAASAGVRGCIQGRKKTRMTERHSR